jgi:putative tricarboxylic transport membrane protein
MSIAKDMSTSDAQNKSGGQMSSGLRTWLPTLIPVALVALGLVLPFFMLKSDQRVSDIGLGPAAWPGTMLSALVVFSALWIVRDIWASRNASRKPTLNFPKDEDDYNFYKALVGLVMIVGYGWLLPKFGFAITTAVFISAWCLFSGLRKLTIVIPVTLIGTVGLLWLFMGLALMPLPRGHGVFGDFSVWLLRSIGIY